MHIAAKHIAGEKKRVTLMSKDLVYIEFLYST